MGENSEINMLKIRVYVISSIYIRFIKPVLKCRFTLFILFYDVISKNLHFQYKYYNILKQYLSILY